MQDLTNKKIHCVTEQEYDAVAPYLARLGYEWCTGRHPKALNPFVEWGRGTKPSYNGIVVRLDSPRSRAIEYNIYEHEYAQGDSDKWLKVADILPAKYKNPDKLAAATEALLELYEEVKGQASISEIALMVLENAKDEIKLKNQ